MKEKHILKLIVVIVFLIGLLILLVVTDRAMRELILTHGCKTCDIVFVVNCCIWLFFVVLFIVADS